MTRVRRPAPTAPRTSAAAARLRESLALYHHLRMPTPFEVATVAALAGHPNIVAIKDTAGSTVNRCAEILAATAGKSFLFLQGVENLALSTLAAGGHGCVLAQACIAPWYFRGLFQAWSDGDEARAQELQDRFVSALGAACRMSAASRKARIRWQALRERRVAVEAVLAEYGGLHAARPAIEARPWRDRAVKASPAGGLRPALTALPEETRFVSGLSG